MAATCSRSRSCHSRTFACAALAAASSRATAWRVFQRADPALQVALLLARLVGAGVRAGDAARLREPGDVGIRLVRAVGMEQPGALGLGERRVARRHSVERDHFALPVGAELAARGGAADHGEVAAGGAHTVEGPLTRGAVGRCAAGHLGVARKVPLPPRSVDEAGDASAREEIERGLCRLPARVLTGEALRCDARDHLAEDVVCRAQDAQVGGGKPTGEVAGERGERAAAESPRRLSQRAGAPPRGLRRRRRP